MRAVLALALLATACRIDLDHAAPADASVTGRSCPVLTTSLCVQATPTYSWIKANIFGRNCGTSSCHDTATSGGKLDLNSAGAYAALVGSGSGAPSIVDPTRMLVVPGDPSKSYLLVMTRSVSPDQANPPATPPNQLRDTNGNLIGYMPQNGTTLCCQKLDALTAWIQQGALNN